MLCAANKTAHGVETSFAELKTRFPYRPVAVPVVAKRVPRYSWAI